MAAGTEERIVVFHIQIAHEWGEVIYRGIDFPDLILYHLLIFGSDRQRLLAGDEGIGDGELGLIILVGSQKVLIGCGLCLFRNSLIHDLTELFYLPGQLFFLNVAQDAVEIEVE